MKVGSFRHLSASFNIFHGLKGHFPNLGGKFYSSRYATFPGPETQDTLICHIQYQDTDLGVMSFKAESPGEQADFFITVENCVLC